MNVHENSDENPAQFKKKMKIMETWKNFVE
jgi:hypothetical protein